MFQILNRRNAPDFQIPTLRIRTLTRTLRLLTRHSIPMRQLFRKEVRTRPAGTETDESLDTLIQQSVDGG